MKALLCSILLAGVLSGCCKPCMGNGLQLDVPDSLMKPPSQLEQLQKEEKPTPKFLV